MKQLIFSAVFVLAVLVLSSCAPRGSEFNAAEVKKMIDEQNAKLGQSMMNDNTDAGMTLYEDGATILPANMPAIKGKEGIKAFYGGMPKMGIKITEAKFTATEVNGSGDIAYEVGRFTMAIDYKGKVEVDTGKYLAVWRKQADGLWKYVADSWSSDRAMMMESEQSATKKKK